MGWRDRAGAPADGLPPLDALPGTGLQPLDAAPTARAAPAVAILLSVCVFAYAAIFLHAAIKGAILTPFGDPHAWDALVFMTEKSGDWLGYLWAPHANQRIVLARALTYLDVAAFGHAHIPVFLIATIGLLFLSAAGLVAILLRETGRQARPGGFAAAVATAIAMLMLNLAAGEDCAFPVFSVYIFVSAFAVLALSAVEYVPASVGLAALLVALAGAALSGFGNAAGLAVWPVLIYSLVRGRRGVKPLVAAAVAGGCLVLASLSGLDAPSTHLGGASVALPAHLLKMLSYFTGYCALPWSAGDGSALLMRLLGLAFAVAGAVAVWRGSRSGGGLGRIEGIGCNLILFALLTGVLASVGRVDESARVVMPARYLPLACLLQVGLIFAFIAPLQRTFASAPRKSWSVLAILMVLLLGQQWVGGHRLMRSAQRVRAASTAFDTGDRSQPVMLLVYPTAEPAMAVRAELKRRGLPF